MRLFYGVKINHKVAMQLENLTHAIKPLCEKAKFYPADNYHMTFLFIGESTKEDLPDYLAALDQVAKASDAFILKTGALGTFYKKNKAILWVGASQGQDHLEDLHNKLTSHLGLKKNTQLPFEAHCTLARGLVFKQGVLLEELKWQSDLPMFVDEISLFESKRVNNILLYVPLATKKLTTAQGR